MLSVTKPERKSMNFLSGKIKAEGEEGAEGGDVTAHLNILGRERAMIKINF